MKRAAVLSTDGLEFSTSAQLLRLSTPPKRPRKFHRQVGGSCPHVRSIVPAAARPLSSYFTRLLPAGIYSASQETWGLSPYYPKVLSARYRTALYSQTGFGC